MLRTLDSHHGYRLTAPSHLGNVDEDRPGVQVQLPAQAIRKTWSKVVDHVR